MQDSIGNFCCRYPAIHKIVEGQKMNTRGQARREKELQKVVHISGFLASAVQPSSGNEYCDLCCVWWFMQVGCGVGNTAFPLLELNPQSQVYVCDFAPSAIELVKAHPQYACGRMHAFVADITCDDLRANVLPRSVDICTMVFVLSAITPAKMPAVRACFQTSCSRLFSLLYCS